MNNRKDMHKLFGGTKRAQHTWTVQRV